MESKPSTKTGRAAKAGHYVDATGQTWILVSGYTTKRGTMVAAYWRRMPYMADSKAKAPRRARTISQLTLAGAL